MKNRILITLLVCLPLGCSARQFASEEQRQQIDQRELEIARLSDQLDSIRHNLQRQKGELAIALEERDEARMDSAINSIDSLVTLHTRVQGDLESEVQKQKATLEEIRQNSAGSLLRLVAPFVPTPLQPLIPFSGSLVAGLLFKRGRENSFKAIKALASGKLNEAFVDAARAMGWQHTNTDPKKIMEGAESAANKAGDTALANKIREARMAMEA